MIDYLIILIIIISFLIPLLIMPLWIKKTRQVGLVWDDMNKIKGDKVSGSGGLIAIVAFIIGVLVYIAYQKFYMQQDYFFIEIFALLLVVTMLSGIALVDDLFGWRGGGKREGLSRRSRIILVALATIPLIAI